MKREKNKRKKTITRRDFLKGTAYGTLGMALGFNQLENPLLITRKNLVFAAENPVSQVVLIRHEKAVEEGHKVNTQIVGEMIDQALTVFTGEKEVLKAWKSLFRPEDTVGVKYTHCGWFRVHTEKAVIDAIVTRLADIGIPKNKIHAGDGSIPLKKCTTLINVPSVKVHSSTGIAAAIKNYINFSDKQLSSYHSEGSAKLGEVWLMPELKGKTRLIIVDALRPYFGIGPQINPLHRWDYKGILIGTDPVAIDTICLRICQLKRNLFRGEEWPITPPAKTITNADKKYRLGTSDPTKIELIRHGWEKEVMI